ncbi:hypothetical protein BKA70DRAFT_1348569 [Coprinopsis sp. MPI-PUGE-AT-0042]|nr:hypothetical protein BKA70DRAFT_1348569 [Coprinopsis sp. MPI-PUGE-AT-0042]
MLKLMISWLYWDYARAILPRGIEDTIEVVPTTFDQLPSFRRLHNRRFMIWITYDTDSTLVFLCVSTAFSR